MLGCLFAQPSPIADRVLFITVGIRFANAPVSWGVDIVDWGAHPPYTKFLDELKAAGYEGTELGPYGYLPTDVAELKDQLGQRSLTLTAAYVGIRLKDPTADLGEVVQVAELLGPAGAEYLVLADRFWPEREAVAGRADECGIQLNREGWACTASNVRKACQVARDIGLRPVFHHHAGTYIETPEEVARLRELTGIGICLDTGHYTYGGGDPVEGAKSLGGRMEYMHWKDVNAERLTAARRGRLSFTQGVSTGVFCPLGDGSFAFRNLLDHLKATGYDGWIVVEQDVDVGDESAHAPFESACTSRKYLRSIMNSRQS